jgi:hypothetical protein
MAYYWDITCDEYIPASPAKANGGQEDPGTASKDAQPNDGIPQTEIDAMNVEEPRKKAKTDAVTEPLATSPAPDPESKSIPGPAHTIISSLSLPARTAPPRVPNSAGAIAQPERIPGTYRGNRLGNGAEMPDSYRLDTVRSFLEPIAWAFGLTLLPHRRPPALALENIRFPVRMSTVAWRAPSDRMRARAGWLEGPVMGVQCRAETEFGSTGTLEAESVLDLVRELGGMLLLAQERTREGMTEQKPGEGKWWVTQPRWGGGSGGEVGEASGGSDVPVEKVAKEEKPARSRLGGKERRRVSAEEMWKTLKPGNGFWDSKVQYEAIGKSAHSEWDEVSAYRPSNVRKKHILMQEAGLHGLITQPSY